jgi:hypothetical protein
MFFVVRFLLVFMPTNIFLWTMTFTWVTQLAQKAKLELGMWKAMYLHDFMKQMTI